MGLLCACGRLRCLTPSALVFEDVDEASWLDEAAVDPERSIFFKINKIDAGDIFTTVTRVYNHVLRKLLLCI